MSNDPGESEGVRVDQNPCGFDMEVWVTLGSFQWRSDGIEWELGSGERKS